MALPPWLTLSAASGNVAGDIAGVTLGTLILLLGIGTLVDLHGFGYWLWSREWNWFQRDRVSCRSWCWFFGGFWILFGLVIIVGCASSLA